MQHPSRPKSLHYLKKIRRKSEFSSAELPAPWVLLRAAKERIHPSRRLFATEYASTAVNHWFSKEVPKGRRYPGTILFFLRIFFREPRLSNPPWVLIFERTGLHPGPLESPKGTSESFPLLLLQEDPILLEVYDFRITSIVQGVPILTCHFGDC